MKFVIFIGFIFCSCLGFSQDKKIDQLEILYDQAFYAKVLRKSSSLIAQPAYDYSGLPAFYNSLALFRMSEDAVWFKRHDYALDAAIEAYQTFLESDRIKDYLSAHSHEISSIKTYLVTLEKTFKSRGLSRDAEKIQGFRQEQLKGIKARPDFVPEKSMPKEDKPKEIAESNVGHGDKDVKKSNFRDKLVVYAKSLIGVKYKWAGRDKSGFDCSGFVGFVHQKYGITIPRTASAQMSSSKKVKLMNAYKGDLIFFASGSNISHVGMVVNSKGDNLIMVHASTSKGVIVTEIEKSSYWKPKLKGAGTFL